ncbi:hypothetical protein [Nocardia goodfellowii]|uniref:Uncharacterized protein n=1 Tax=Nocardia goodfellowii TaxID=882446 RepID=A0ABS4QS00_9NOCA|nr:hypothetical protein [Nocardia goodfellowii]MBP2194323.1 hypothetical protein [Nocardia goodfellowii]
MDRDRDRGGDRGASRSGDRGQRDDQKISDAIDGMAKVVDAVRSIVAPVA